MPAKIKKIGYCIYCNQEVNLDLFGHHMTKHKDKRISYFHEDCYRRYNPLVQDSWLANSNGNFASDIIPKEEKK